MYDCNEFNKSVIHTFADNVNINVFNHAGIMLLLFFLFMLLKGFPCKKKSITFYPKQRWKMENH